MIIIIITNMDNNNTENNQTEKKETKRRNIRNNTTQIKHIRQTHMISKTNNNTTHKTNKYL